MPQCKVTVYSVRFSPSQPVAANVTNELIFPTFEKGNSAFYAIGDAREQGLDKFTLVLNEEINGVVVPKPFLNCDPREIVNVQMEEIPDPV